MDPGWFSHSRSLRAHIYYSAGAERSGGGLGGSAVGARAAPGSAHAEPAAAAAAPGSQRPCARHLRELRGEPRRERLCSAFVCIKSSLF